MKKSTRLRDNAGLLSVMASVTSICIGLLLSLIHISWTNFASCPRPWVRLRKRLWTGASPPSGSGFSRLPVSQKQTNQRPSGDLQDTLNAPCKSGAL